MDCSRNVWAADFLPRNTRWICPAKVMRSTIEDEQQCDHNHRAASHQQHAFVSIQRQRPLFRSLERDGLKGVLRKNAAQPGHSAPNRVSLVLGTLVY
jgi:hypothetical protein